MKEIDLVFKGKGDEICTRQYAAALIAYYLRTRPAILSNGFIVYPSRSIQQVYGK